MSGSVSRPWPSTNRSRRPGMSLERSSSGERVRRTASAVAPTAAPAEAVSTSRVMSLNVRHDDGLQAHSSTADGRVFCFAHPRHEMATAVIQDIGPDPLGV